MTQKLMTAASVREALGGVSDMTMWRWLNEPTMKFPQPIYINRRRYWREGDITNWLQTRTPVAAE